MSIAFSIVRATTSAMNHAAPALAARRLYVRSQHGTDPARAERGVSILTAAGAALAQIPGPRGPLKARTSTFDWATLTLWCGENPKP